MRPHATRVGEPTARVARPAQPRGASEHADHDVLRHAHHGPHPMTLTAPYGAWDSPITPDAMVALGRRYGYPEFDCRGAPVWLESRPDEGGRSVVCRRRDDGSVEELTPRGFDARSRVHEYGGRPFVLDGDALWCADFADQRLARIEGARVTLRSTGEGWRFVDALVDARRDRIVAVAERHTGAAREAQNGLAAIDRATGEVRWLVEGFDFVMAPALSPDGARLAFVAWNHPHMSWDAAALWVCDVADDGALTAPARVAGGPDGSVNQLLWRDARTLLFTLEVDDRWQLHAWDGASVRRIGDVPGELGAPMWNLGTRALALASPDVALCVSHREGVSRVVRVELDTGAHAVVFDAIPHVGALAVSGGDVLMVPGYNAIGPAVLRLDAGGRLEALAGEVPAGPWPEAVAFPTEDGAVAWAFLHAPACEGFAAPEGTLPPLLVTAHGGPTGCASPLPTAAVRFWTSRGFALLDVNYRGSTGFGRAYREALRGRWGVLDVADCVAGARHLTAAGRVRGDAMFIRGASAGGYTVLQALCDHDVFRGAACHFGVSDPRALMAETHKFESRYDAFLYGEGEAFERAMRERTPLHHPERIRAPVIFFQGAEDLAVLPAQTTRIHEALRARGLPSECYVYEGEQHGFRRADTLRDVYTREAAFYRRLLGV